MNYFQFQMMRKQAGIRFPLGKNFLGSLTKLFKHTKPQQVVGTVAKPKIFDYDPVMLGYKLKPEAFGAVPNLEKIVKRRIQSTYTTNQAWHELNRARELQLKAGEQLKALREKAAKEIRTGHVLDRRGRTASQIEYDQLLKDLPRLEKNRSLWDNVYRQNRILGYKLDNSIPDVFKSSVGPQIRDI